MDPIATLWFASLAGAAGFTATGVFLARMLDKTRAAEKSAPPSEVTAAPAQIDNKADEERIAALEAELEETKAAAAKAEKESALLAKGRNEAESVCADLERQLETVRVELRTDIAARTRAEARATQLAAQLASAGRSRPPAAGPGPVASTRPEPLVEAPPSRDRLASRAPGLFAEITDLQKEVSRLRGENQTLLAASNTHRRRPPRNTEELVIPDTEALRRLVERVGRLDGVRGVVVADTMGSVLAGAGELLEPIGAFGAYVSDAASRVELLLPLESADEIVVRDRKLGVVSTLRLGDPRIELALVMFAVDEGPTREMQQVVARSGLGR